MIAGERRDGGLPLAEVDGPEVENEFGFHALEDLTRGICSQTECGKRLRVLHTSGGGLARISA